MAGQPAGRLTDRALATSNAPEPLTLERVRTPIGTLMIVGDADGRLRAAEFEDVAHRLQRSLRLNRATPGGYLLNEGRTAGDIRARLQAYFAGEVTAIDHIAVATGGTAFQQTVWRALRRIAPGTTLTYGGLAQRLGAANAMRAVGAANGANPVSIVVPCHRLVGADGSLIRYGGGVARKRWLLQHEGAEVP